MSQKFSYMVIGAIFGAMVFAGSAHAAASKPAPKVDCTQKKNAKKLECKEAPKSNVKPELKKPEKVRKAPTSVQKKAEANNKK